MATLAAPLRTADRIARRLRVARPADGARVDET